MLKYFLSLKVYYFLPILKEVKTFFGAPKSTVCPRQCTYYA